MNILRNACAHDVDVGRGTIRSDTFPLINIKIEHTAIFRKMKKEGKIQWQIFIKEHLDSLEIHRS